MVGNVSLMLACNELIGLVGPSHVSLISANQSSAQTIRSRATDMADARRCGVHASRREVMRRHNQSHAATPLTHTASSSEASLRSSD